MVWPDYLHGNRGKKEAISPASLPESVSNSHLWFSVSTVAAGTITDPLLPLQLREQQAVFPVTKGEASDSNPLKEHRCCNSNFCGHVYKISTTLLSVCTDCSSVHLSQKLPLSSSILPRHAPEPAVSGSMRSPQARCLLALLCCTTEHPLELGSLQPSNSISSSPLTDGS